VTQTYSLGNYVWIDANNSGHVDNGEGPVPDGVVVELLDGLGNPTGLTTVTSNGYYRFDDLPAGDYQVRLAASNFQGGGLLADYASSTGANQEASPNSNGDQNDNGVDAVDPSATGIVSATVTIGDGEPTLESPTASGIAGNDGAGTPDANSNLTVDFGVVPPTPPETYSIGNYVWIDANNSGHVDNGEGPVPDGVLVELLDGLGNPTGLTTVTSNGYYRFDDLPAGDYQVRLAASNFQGGGLLDDYDPSTGANQEADPDSDGDQNDNGSDPADPSASGITSATVTIGDGEPTLESPTASGVAGDDGAGTPDANSNLTVDFGVVPPPPPETYSIGNFVWIDANNSGHVDNGEGPIPDGVVVELLDGSGNPTGQTAVTSNGYYLFDDLPAGDYQVALATSNFGPGGLLEGYLPSTGGLQEADPDSDGDQNDNGSDPADPSNTRIVSATFTLGNGEPTDELPTASGIAGDDGAGTLDVNSNLTVDFGLVPPPQLLAFSIGNYIWIDSNNSGHVDNGEGPVPDGVVVELLDNNGDPTGLTTTTTDGYYLFDNLEPGEYHVRIAASNFQDGGLLVDFSPSTGPNQEANPNNDGDQNDNGDDPSDPAADGIVSATIFLLNDEPTDETPTASGNPGDDGAGTPDANSNLTVDFGVVPPSQTPTLNLGNLVWFDDDNDGVRDGDEDGVEGVTVNLYQGDDLIATTTTDGDGEYLFTNLEPGDYVVEIILPDGYVSSDDIGTSDDPNNDVDDDDNGVNIDGDSVRSNEITLSFGDEPDGDDNNTNLSVDFGIYEIDPSLFDPPSGRKVFNDDGLPEIEWTMVWINDGNVDPILVRITDPIPDDTSYVEDSLECEARGDSVETLCEYDEDEDEIVWEGQIAADPGATDEDEADNEIVITFRVTLDNDDVDEVSNRGTAITDLDGDNDLDNETRTTNSNESTWRRDGSGGDSDNSSDDDDDDDDDDDGGDGGDGGGDSGQPVAQAPPVSINGLLTKTVNPPFINTDEPVTWTITATNPNDQPLTNVVIRDTIPTQLEVQSADSTAGAVEISGQTVRVELDVMQPGQTVVVTIETTIRPEAREAFDVNNAALLTFAENPNPLIAQANLIAVERLPDTGEATDRTGLNAVIVAAISLLLGAAGLTLRRASRRG
jgi:uncharacterized repeat protein (TIGR01451 family)